MTNPDHSKYRLRAALVKLLFTSLARLSLQNIHRVGSMLGWLALLFPNRNRRISRINIQHCFPDYDGSRKQRLLRDSLVETGKTATEVSAMWLWDSARIMATIKQVQGEELLQQAYAAGKGVILAFPHLGNWELVSLYCSSRYPMTTLYQPPRLTQLDDMMRHGREQLGARLVATDNRGVKALLTTLKQGEMVGVLPDQEPKSGNGVFAPFFGIPAYSGTLVSRLTSKTGARVVFAYARRLEQGQGYQLEFKAAEEKIYSDDVMQSVESLNRSVEDCVRTIPEQYQWSYYRYRTRPEGEERFY